MTSVFQVNSGHHHPGLPEEWTKVFVGGLCQKTTDRKLREHFVKFGPLHSCLVVKNKSTGAGRGFGFVSPFSVFPLYLFIVFFFVIRYSNLLLGRI